MTAPASSGATCQLGKWPSMRINGFGVRATVDPPYWPVTPVLAALALRLGATASAYSRRVD